MTALCYLYYLHLGFIFRFDIFCSVETLTIQFGLGFKNAYKVKHNKTKKNIYFYRYICF